MSSTSWFGFVLSNLTPETNAKVFSEARACVKDLGANLSGVHLDYAMVKGRGFVRVGTPDLHMSLAERGLGARLARTLGCDVWEYVEQHAADEWLEIARLHAAGSGDVREVLGGEAREVASRLGLELSALDADEGQERVAAAMATHLLSHRLQLSLEDLERLREADDARQPLGAEVIPGLLEGSRGPTTASMVIPITGNGLEKIELKFELPESTLQELQMEAARLDKSLAWVVEQAWRAAKDAVRETHSADALPYSAAEIDDELFVQSLFLTSKSAKELFSEAKRLHCEPSRLMRATWSLGRRSLAKLAAAKR